MLQPNIYNINKPNFTYFNTQKKCLQTTALRLLYLFPLFPLSLRFFPKVKVENLWSEATHIHPKKARKTGAFY